mgnify:CR=1 FL=1
MCVVHRVRESITNRTKSTTPTRFRRRRSIRSGPRQQIYKPAPALRRRRRITHQGRRAAPGGQRPRRALPAGLQGQVGAQRPPHEGDAALRGSGRGQRVRRDAK